MSGINLTIEWFPGVELGFPWPVREFHLCKEVPHAQMKVGNVMQSIELLYEQVCAEHYGPEEQKWEMQVQAMVNKNDTKRALPMGMMVSECLKDGDTVCCYGEAALAQDPAEKPEVEKIPVTILTGFLGAGKTTFLNYILTEQSDKKIAVIENEFGEVPIDQDLLAPMDLGRVEKVVVMENGCICCQGRDDLMDGLGEIVQSIREAGKIDQIIIETTGMADPAPIIRTFLEDQTAIKQELRLDAVVTLVDAKNILRKLEEDVEEGKVNEAFQQIQFSDKILLNKVDLVDMDQLMHVRTKIREINKFAKIFPSQKGRIDLKEIADLRCYDLTNFGDNDMVMLEETGNGHGHGHGHGHGYAHDGDKCNDDSCKDHEYKDEHLDDASHGHGHGYGHSHGGGHSEQHKKKQSRHDGRVHSFSIMRKCEISPTSLARFMQQIGQCEVQQKGTLYRSKAIFAVKGMPHKHAFHAVMDTCDEEQLEPWGENEEKVCKMVFIGRNLDRPWFEGLFEDMVTNSK
eukprot:gnl/MRDRNA2_/MRDRNA2_28326_c0_seq1.p1 gnl/MRDRNA2_/MRDRNA2_28326_c0~~gnl/MRDRNA2_/MRDRNA2_28326_c0_seq1.p1  ORF type:complete len:515 (-),score=113.50 gnl/MRDRNA2_/MRDRNA2_28326_c0_seq1:887-2431(-)